MFAPFQDLTAAAGFSFRNPSTGRLITVRAGQRFWVTGVDMTAGAAGIVYIAREGAQLGQGFPFGEPDARHLFTIAADTARHPMTPEKVAILDRAASARWIVPQEGSDTEAACRDLERSGHLESASCQWGSEAPARAYCNTAKGERAARLGAAA